MFLIIMKKCYEMGIRLLKGETNLVKLSHGYSYNVGGLNYAVHNLKYMDEN